MRDKNCNCENCDCGRSSSGGGMLTGVLLGALLGAGVVIYANSDKGKEKMKELKEKSKDYRAELEKKFEEIKQKGMESVEGIRDELQEKIADIDFEDDKPTRRPARRKYNQ